MVCKRYIGDYKADDENEKDKKVKAHQKNIFEKKGKNDIQACHELFYSVI